MARGFLLILVVACAARAGRLYVFFPSTARPQVLQERIAALKPGLEVTVFGRYKDFEARMAAAPADVVLSLPPVLETLPGYAIRHRSRRQGADQERFVLLSVDRKLDPAKTDGVTLGAVDILGRKGMKAFLAAAFDQASPAVKTVTKIEDLLPLLTFKMAEGILVTESQSEYFRSVSNLNFVKTPMPHARCGTVSLAARTEAGAKAADGVLKALKAMDKDLRQMMGDVQWN